MKKAIRVIDGREALPVRAVPLVTDWCVTANNLAQKLSDVDDKPSFAAYRYNNGNPIPIKPESWGVTLDCLEDMVRELKSSELQDNDNRQIAWRKSLEQLPAGVFVWVDEFAEWYGATYIAHNTVWVEQHRVIGEDDDPEPVFHPQRPDALELYPIKLRDFESIIFEGFETPENMLVSPTVAPLDGELDQSTSPEYIAGWWDASMDASSWWSNESMAPIHAALILSGHNPNDGTPAGMIETAEITTGGGIGPREFRALKNAFEGANNDKPRTLKNWMEYAQQHGQKIHSWLGEWLQAGGAPLPLSTPQTAPASGVSSAAVIQKPIQRTTAQDAAIMAEILHLQLNPLAMQKTDTGKSGARALIRKSMIERDAKGYAGTFSSLKVFETAWQRLRGTGKICNV